MWWLDKDQERRELIDSIAVSASPHDELQSVAAFCEELQGDAESDAQSAYFPLPARDDHHILATLFDGVALCEAVHALDADFMDVRVIERATDGAPLPLELAAKNASLLLSAAKAMGVALSS